MALPSFREALDYAKKRRIVLPDEFYDKANKDRHGELLTISNLAGLTQIQAVVDDLAQALAEGETLEQWKKRLRSTDKAGELSPERLETIFRNYLQTAYNGGRWESFEKNQAQLPYLMYSAINDDRTTDICRSRNGIIRPVGDSFWATNSPQGHHRCRSTLVALTKSQATARSTAQTGLNQKAPDTPMAEGWGYKPTLTKEGQATALANVLKEKLKDIPRSFWDKITSLFTSIWALLGKLL